MRANRLATIAAGTLLALTGCQKRVSVSFPPVPALPPAPVAALDEADRAFNAGNYIQAAQGYENYLRLAPSGGQRDLALFRLGLTYALRTAPSPDWQRTTAVLRQLTQEYPRSPLTPPANLILSLRSGLDRLNADTKQREDRIRQLTTELDRLKKIDADRRRGTKN